MTEMSKPLVRAGMQLPASAESGLMDVAPSRVKSKIVWQEAQKLINVTSFPAKRTRVSKLLLDEISSHHSGSGAFTTIKRFHVRLDFCLNDDPYNPVFFGNALQRIDAWLGQPVEISGDTKLKSSAQVTIPNLYFGDRVNVTVLEKRLVEGSPENAAFRGRICTRGIEVGLRFQNPLDLDEFSEAIVDKAFPTFTLNWIMKKESLRPQEQYGLLGLYESGALRSIGMIDSVSKDGIRVRIKNGFEILDPDANQEIQDGWVQPFVCKVVIFGVQLS